MGDEPNPDVLTNSAASIAQNQAEDGGRAWTVSGSLPAGAAPTETQLLAVQSATCTAVLEDGTVVPGASEPKSASLLSASSPVAMNRSGSGAPTADPPHEAWVKGQYNDALTLQLTAVEDYVVWTYNGTCVTSAGAGANLVWDAYTGWYVTHTHHTYGAGCSDVWSQSVTTFENALCTLCEGYSVFTYYDPEGVHGNANGTLSETAVLWGGPGFCGDYI